MCEQAFSDSALFDHAVHSGGLIEINVSSGRIHPVTAAVQIAAQKSILQVLPLGDDFLRILALSYWNIACLRLTVQLTAGLVFV